MTRSELDSAKHLAKEALFLVDKSIEEFAKAEKASSEADRRELEVQAWSHQGCAEGISYTLFMLGFENSDTKKLDELF